MKNIVILGSSGSIGSQTLEVVQNNPDICVLGLSVYNELEILEEQIKKFNPLAVAVAENSAAKSFEAKAKELRVTLYKGTEGLCELAALKDVSLVVSAIVGFAGLNPTLSAINAGKDIALANKETLVAAGELVMKLAKEKNVSILPVDSEHSAIFQCLFGYKEKAFNKIYLTASGGPFRNLSKAELFKVTKEQALNHPNWVMGAKITIDSATLMNKGLEVIEAKWLFDCDLDKIEVLVHPQSVIHSMVEYDDGSVIAQLGEPDMRIPIAYTITYPQRRQNPFNKLDFTKRNTLTFEKPDLDRFPCLALAFESLKMGGSAPCVLNSANETAVSLFLNSKIKFMDIPDLVEKALFRHTPIKNYTLAHLEYTHQETADFIYNIVRLH